MEATGGKTLGVALRDTAGQLASATLVVLRTTLLTDIFTAI